MKTKLKLCLTFLLIGITLLTYAIPAYAEDAGISPRLTNMDSSAMHFAVVDNIAEVYVSYKGRSSTFLRAEVSVKIEKKVLLLFWKDVSEWTSTNTEVFGYLSNISFLVYTCEQVSAIMVRISQIIACLDSLSSKENIY